MAKATKFCKICGKEYEYCHTLTPGIFRWQDVACCPEHAKQYFAQVDAARSKGTSSVPEDEPATIETSSGIDELDDEYLDIDEDEESDEEFDEESDEPEIEI